VSRTAVSMLYGLSRLEGGVEGPIVGRLIDRVGPRWIIMAGAGLTGLGFLILSHAQNYLSVLIIFVSAIALGYNAGFYHPISTAVNSWFIRRRAISFAILDAVGSLGAMVLVPLLSYWVLALGWRTGATMAGLITLAVVLPLALVMHRSPESRGLQPDGPPLAGSPDQMRVDFGVRQAVGTSSFWLLTLATTLRLSVSTALAAHMVPILVWRGMAEGLAAYGVSLFAFGGIVTPLVFGWLGDRYSKTRLSALGAAVTAAGLLLLFRSTSPSLLYLLPLATAVALGTAPLNWSLLGDYFGRTSYGSLRGWMRIANGIGAFIFPVGAGWLFDRTASYSLVLLLFAIVLIVSALLFLRLRHPVQAAHPVS
ncbi:MAG: MFS transporter, partial [Chloroflexota bacterium]